MRHLNSLNLNLLEFSLFGPNLFMFGWDFIDSNNFKSQRSNVLKYPSRLSTSTSKAGDRGTRNRGRYQVAQS